MFDFCLKAQALSIYGLNILEVKERAVTTGTGTGVKVPWKKETQGKYQNDGNIAEYYLLMLFFEILEM